MSHSESPDCNDEPRIPASGIREVCGALSLLAIISDEDDAATIRADLKRSRLSEYKLQSCRSIADGRNLLQSSVFDLVFLDFESIEDPESEIERLRVSGYENPVIGLTTRRAVKRPQFIRPNGIDDLVIKDDLSPSLVESAIRSTIARRTLAGERALLESRLHLSLETGRMGSWTYFPKQDRFLLDTIALAMLKLPPSPAEKSLDELLAQAFPEDRAALSETLDRFPLKNDLLHCQFRVNGDEMPLPSMDIRGRIWPGKTQEETVLIGVIRETPKSNELFERIAEANTAIQEAFQAREDALRKADQKLKALADEFGLHGIPSPETSPAAPEAPAEPAKELATTHAPPPKMTVTKIVSKKTAAKKKATAPDNSIEENKQATQAEPLAKEEAAESLKIDKDAAYEEVMKSVARKKAATPKQESLPFDFAQEPVVDYSPPNPSKEGFISAAKRMVAMTRKEHGLDASISIADQQSIELEEKRDLLFEILRELLTNVVRHSQAKLCIVTLFRDEDEWVLQVEDDGVGLDDTLKSVNAPLNKIGLFQIRTQLALKGGHLDMVPASPNGLIARVRIPVSIRDGAKSN